MGMDVMHYVVNRVVPESEMKLNISEPGWIDLPDGFHAIDVNKRTIEWMKKNSFDESNIQTIKEFDWEKWEKEHPQYENYDCYDYCVNGEKEHWIQLTSPENETILLTDGFSYKNVSYLIVESKEVGYMRKPFRHYDAPSYKDGDTIVLTFTNFSDKGVDGYSELKKIDEVQTENANVYLFDKNQVKLLQKYSYDEKVYQSNFMEDWTDKSYVQFNW